MLLARNTREKILARLLVWEMMHASSLSEVTLDAADRRRFQTDARRRQSDSIDVRGVVEVGNAGALIGMREGGAADAAT
ncbi:MAG: hypothetical protein H7327_14585 [Herminiimonas sp.]|nr:hypothetical protein [Herminiimonas sp.]